MIQKKKETLRESFTIPAKEQEYLETLLDKFSVINPKINKSEIIRVGIYKVNQAKALEVKEILENKLGRLAVGKPKIKELDEKKDAIEIIVNDKQWGKIAQLIPQTRPANGRPETQSRLILNGILYIFRYEIQRRNVPKIYGSYTTCWRRLKMWKKEDLWRSICEILISKAHDTERHELGEILLKTFLIEN